MKKNSYVYRRLQYAADKCPHCGGLTTDDCRWNGCPTYVQKEVKPMTICEFADIEKTMWDKTKELTAQLNDAQMALYRAWVERLEEYCTGLMPPDTEGLLEEILSGKLIELPSESNGF